MPMAGPPPAGPCVRLLSRAVGSGTPGRRAAGAEIADALQKTFPERRRRARPICEDQASERCSDFQPQNCRVGNSERTGNINHGFPGLSTSECFLTLVHIQLGLSSHPDTPRLCALPPFAGAAFD